MTLDVLAATLRLLVARNDEYNELLAAAKLALCAIDSRISAETTPVREEDRVAYEALCRVIRKS